MGGFYLKILTNIYDFFKKTDTYKSIQFINLLKFKKKKTCTTHYDLTIYIVVFKSEQKFSYITLFLYINSFLIICQKKKHAYK